MAKKRDEENLVGEDSFLDVVANLVGVLIILVTVVSMQAGVAVSTVSQSAVESQEVHEAQANLWEAERLALTVTADCVSIQGTIDRQLAENAILEQIRHEALVQLQVVEQAISAQRAALDEKSQMAFDQTAKQQSLEVQVSRLKEQLARSDSEIAQVNKKELIHYPAPIAKTVFSNEVHYLLSKNRLSHVPIDSLLQELKASWQDQVNADSQNSEIMGVTGPQEGFKMRYRLVAERVQQGDRQGVAVKLGGFEIEVDDENYSEPLESALQDGSRFQTRLQRLTPGKTTVSIWVHPDSFPQFMELKKMLREAGFQTAGWPLQTGGRISGGPNGLRTSAQ